MNLKFENIFRIISRFFLVLFFFHGVAYMDASHPWQTGFQDPATPIMEGIIFFNGLLMSFMILISCLVGWLLYKSLSLFNESVHKNPVSFTHSTLLEVVWTIIPAVILMIISVPSYNLLYAMDEVIDPSLTIKVVGHQWYWSYECSDFEVSPKAQEKSKELLNSGQKILNLWADKVKDANLDVGISQDNAQITTLQSFLEDLDTNLKDFSRDLSAEESDILSSHLNIISKLFGENKEVFIYEDFEKHLEKVKFVDEQKELLVKILKTFQHYLNFTEDLSPSDLKHRLMTSIFFINLINGTKELPFENLEDHLSGIYDFEGSDAAKNRDSDDDSNGDEGSVVAELMDFDESKWCELDSLEKISDQDYYNLKTALGDLFTSERRCNNAALLEPEPEDKDRPFLELVNDLIKDMRKFKKAKRVEELSESNLIDIQLIDHQLKLTRPEREIYSSEFSYDKALKDVDFAENEFNVVSDELNSAKLYSHLCNVDLAASNVNKLTAEYFRAEASSAVTDPKLLRSAWINKNGYYSWHKFLKLVAKELSETERMAFIHADEELCRANCLLGKAQTDLTADEIIRSNSIADNAKAKFLAMEREVISAVEELKRGDLILEEAKYELQSYQEIADKSNKRLEKAQNAFDKAKAVLDREKSKLRGAERVFKNAQLNLVDSPSSLGDTFINDNLENAQAEFLRLKNDFNSTVSDISKAKHDLSLCKKRLKKAKINLLKTQEAFKNTGLLRTHAMRDGAYLEYYPNYLWEMRQEDLAFVKDQWETDISYYIAFDSSLKKVEKQLSNIAGDLLESELSTSKLLIEKLKYDGVDNDILLKAENHLFGLRLEIAEAIYKNALDTLDNSEDTKLILYLAEKDLHNARLRDTSGYSGSVLRDVDGVDYSGLIINYAGNCLDRVKSELAGAKKDYAEALSVLDNAESLLGGVTKTLSNDYDNPYLETLRYLHKKTLLSLINRFQEVNLTRLDSSPLDIKLDPGFLQSRSYEEVLLAKAELANVKWLCARVAKTLNIPLSNDVKPFNVQFSYLKDNPMLKLVGMDNTSSEDVSVLDNNFAGEDGSSGDKNIPYLSPELIEFLHIFAEKQLAFVRGELDDTAKSISEIKKIISQIPDRDFLATMRGLEKKIIYEYTDLLKVVSESDSYLLLGILNLAFEDIIKNHESYVDTIKAEVNSIKEVLDNGKEEDDDTEMESDRINFDSYLITEEDLVIPEALGTGKAGKVFRLLEVDNRLFVPTNTHIRLLVTSADVLHSWAVPSLGIKVDACPGRLNQVFFFVKREGVFYGQCSELCGVNHGFMPIVVQAVSQDDYLTWVGKRLCS